LQFGKGVRLPPLGGEPFLQCLLEAFDAPMFVKVQYVPD
jgi:hypothetical protein